MPKKTYKAFSAGELSPDMYGRYDVDKYGTGCMILKNYVIMAQGGVYKRPGTRFAGQAGKESQKVRLIPFESSTITGLEVTRAELDAIAPDFKRKV